MKAPKGQERAWVQARVNEAGGIEKARPADFSQTAWRELCRHFGVRSPRFKQVSSLEDALRAVAERAAA